VICCSSWCVCDFCSLSCRRLFHSAQWFLAYRQCISSSAISQRWALFTPRSFVYRKTCSCSLVETYKTVVILPQSDIVVKTSEERYKLCSPWCHASPIDLFPASNTLNVSVGRSWPAVGVDGFPKKIINGKLSRALNSFLNSCIMNTPTKQADGLTNGCRVSQTFIRWVAPAE